MHLTCGKQNTRYLVKKLSRPTPVKGEKMISSRVRPRGTRGGRGYMVQVWAPAGLYGANSALSKSHIWYTTTGSHPPSPSQIGQWKPKHEKKGAGFSMFSAV